MGPLWGAGRGQMEVGTKKPRYIKAKDKSGQGTDGGGDKSKISESSFWSVLKDLKRGADEGDNGDQTKGDRRQAYKRKS